MRLAARLLLLAAPACAVLPAPAHAWWVRGAGWGPPVLVAPPVVVAPSVVVAPPVVLPPPVVAYAPPRPAVWVPAHWDRFGRWHRAHWA